MIDSENIFLIILGLIWITGAVIQDLKRREVDNLWNFSLIAIALAYRISFSVYSGNYWFFINGLIGVFLFLILGNLFYYSRLFAGGDAKLLIALGAILPLSYNWMINLKIFGLFVLLFLVLGSFYALIWSVFLVFDNLGRFRKEFERQFRFYKKLFFAGIIFSFFWTLFSLIIGELLLIFISFIIILFPLLFIFSKSIEESCMIKSLSPYQVSEGDWLYRDITVNGKKINANWEGVSKKELENIRKYYRKKILIKQGIPFTPSFLFAFIGLLIISWKFRWMIG